eukprot:CAMPEP_0202812864 /NCGR_PEP_ID=MMETSP1389-20130828/4417_1 /ASSEMBLY_ACC=CAM_ASM_000865 /TAXON_ID=302021 /ORGANISM="Rhodomonas sp., Strain CCMP768" /LENGTH=288 /DNA_ID=CAMNT_0049484349 /DNA_START=30 /DNA_END=896 /DNA_ORIENTATION=+
MAADRIDDAIPLISAGWGKILIVWDKLQPYKPKIWGPTLFGLILVFFGGRFLTTIAAVEAVRLLGFDNLKTHTLVLWDNFKKAKDAAKKDEGPDGDESKDKKGHRIALVVLKAVDPQEISLSIAGVYEIMLAVIATLRFKFAAAVTLGCSMGEMFQTGARAYAQPHLEASIPREHHKWIEPGIVYGCKGTGIALALVLQRVMSAMHCSMRGSYIVVLSAQAALVELKYLDKVKFTEDNPYFMLIVSLIAMVGFVNQVASGFGLPFPLSFFFLPVYIVEWLLTFMVGSV